jgi:hypothetical protein
MANMFQNAASFNQPLGSWKISNVVDMSFMFYEATSFNQKLQSWDTSSVVNMTSMFESASSFNQPLDIWDISKVVSMEAMFSGASSFNQNLCLWYTNISKEPFPLVIDMFSNSNCADMSDPDFKIRSSFCSACHYAPVR